MIRHSAESQGRLIDDILDTARIITGKFRLEARQIEVGGILQAAVEIMKPSDGLKGIALAVLNANQSCIILGERVCKTTSGLLRIAVTTTFLIY